MASARMKLVGAAAVALVAAAGAAPAQAAQSAGTGTGTGTGAGDGVVALAAGGTAPACIERQSSDNPDGGTQVWIRNLCGKTMRVKVVVKNWPDSGCKTLENHTGWYYHSLGGRYDRTAVC